MRLRLVLARPLPAAALTAAALVPVLLLLVGQSTSGPSWQPVDFGLFGPAGADLLTGHWGRVYGDPAVQAGPYGLAPFGVAQLLGVSGSGWTLVLTACCALTAFFAALLLRPAIGPSLRASAVAAAGATVLVLAGPIPSSWTIGHPSEIVIPLLWVAAGRLALDDRPVAAAVVVALSSGMEAWGLLGAPVVLLAGRVRIVAPAFAATVVLALLWAPFVAAGPFRMLAYRWPVSPDSLLHLALPDVTSVPWALRLVQAAVAVGAGLAVALLLRRRDPAWALWSVPIAVVAARLVLDPVLSGYYWAPTTVGAVGLLALASLRRELGAAAVGALALLLTADLGGPVLRAGLLLALAVLAAVAVHRRYRPVPLRGRVRASASS